MQYVKIKDSIKEQIETGMLAPRQKLPSERKLAESFDTTRVTLREALALLEAEGSIYREDRRGWFISPQPLIYDLSTLASFTEVARTQERMAKTELLMSKTGLANKQAASLLKLPPFSDVYHLERVRYLENRPVAFVTHYIRPELFPNLLDFDLSDSLSGIYLNHFGVHFSKVTYRIGVSTLLGELALALRATPGTQAMVIERIKYDRNGTLIEGEIEYWRHDAISIQSQAILDQ
ncbi:phosphonate utilization transcriptional regulator PhnR [Vibrio sinaloensis]|uniref:phosphonate utilization transcriptional regulator PhnR n=1 Tax=Photobacterium sp. (strain ATCC 43367) TaxID=379097 RepID=UPI0022B04841|nr:phosphonate utilization transcriptional regulator PhnR [Vibrio sinaloensis]MCZ4292645.1 phosphonate utilization transcriptional regulator PhnR [Vibrio sinaloensis]